MNAAVIVAQIVFVVGVDVIFLIRLLDWPWQKAAGMAVVINIASAFAAVFAGTLIMQRLPVGIFDLYQVYHHYARLPLLSMAIAFAATVAAEFAICRAVDKVAQTPRLWGVVIAMNLITALPGDISGYMRGRPQALAGFTLTERADWLAVTDTLYYVELPGRCLVKAACAATNTTVLSAALPRYGYGIAADGRACVFDATNSLALMPAALADQIVWWWTTNQLAATTNVFAARDATVVVHLRGGFDLVRAGVTNRCALSGDALRLCLGIGWLSDGRSFLIQIGHEILALDAQERRVGHVANGLMCVLEQPRFRRVPIIRPDRSLPALQ